MMKRFSIVEVLRGNCYVKDKSKLRHDIYTIADPSIREFISEIFLVQRRTVVSKGYARFFVCQIQMPNSFM